MNIQRQKKDFDEKGFTVLRQFFEPSEIVKLKSKINEYIEKIAPQLPEDKVFYEDNKNANSIKQLFDISDYDPFFQSVLNGSKVEEMAQILLGEKTSKGFVEYFNKPAGVGKPTPPHQDGFYFKLSPPNALTFWIPLEDVDEENGCLRYVAGSHKRGMRPHGRTQTLGFSQGIVDYGTEEDLKNEIAIPAQASDVLVHHGMTIHRADANTSTSRSRKVLGLVYFGESAQEDVEAKRKYQEKLNRERTN